MSTLSNPKHEILAQSLAVGKTATEAMDEAGYSDPRNSTRLTKNDEIQSRVKELQSKAAERAIVTIEDIARQLDEDREFARQCGSASASVAATMGKAKVLGLVTDKTESKTELSVDNSIAALMAEINGKTRSK